MRADRLISILLLLQQKKKIRAIELANELHVSLRTIYRDLTVLSASGFPIYAEKGPGGGCCIVDDYKSTLARITPAELNALKMIDLPQSLSSLEMGKILQRALLKLYAAPSDNIPADTCLFIDWNDWRQGEDVSPDTLELLYQAASQHLQIRIKYSLWNNVEIDQVIAPYGIVAKAGEWYVIYAVGDNIRYERVRMISSIQLLAEKFAKPVSFDLAETWRRSCKLWGTDRHSYLVKINASAEAAKYIRDSVWKSPYRIQSISKPRGDEINFFLELVFENLPSARSYLLGWGNSVEVVEPEPLRFSIADFARQVLKIYE